MTLLRHWIYFTSQVVVFGLALALADIRRVVGELELDPWPGRQGHQEGMSVQVANLSETINSQSMSR